MMSKEFLTSLLTAELHASLARSMTAVVKSGSCDGAVELKDVTPVVTAWVERKMAGLLRADDGMGHEASMHGLANILFIAHDLMKCLCDKAPKRYRKLDDPDGEWRDKKEGE